MDGDIPSEERQAWLIEQVAVLVARVGSEQFLRAPILEPTPAFFPEGWSPDVQGAVTITRRLLDQAGLQSLDLELVEFERLATGDADDGRHVIGYFRGIEAGVCRFGVRAPSLVDAEYVAGVMAHEVAHAFRHEHSLCHEDHAIEEELTDLTTVFLGGAIVTGNLSERVVVERSPQMISLKRSKAGYLDVEDFAFLFALQLCARNASDQAILRLGRFLGSAQRYCVMRCLDTLGSDAQAMRRELGIDVSEVSALPQPIAPILAPSSTRWTRPWGRVVYIARYSQAAAGVLIGVAVGLVALPVVQDRDLVLVAWGALALLGALLGRVLPRRRCSGCRMKLPRNARECPHCAGFVLGTLPNPPAVFNVGENRRARVTRVHGRRTASYAAWGAILGGCLAVILFALRLSLGDATTLVLATTILGGIIGRRLRHDTCSGPSCTTVLEPTMNQCPRCLGEVHGPIDNMD